VPALGSYKLAELEPKLLDRWLRRLGSVPREGAARALSPTSVRIVRKVLSMACEEAAQRGLLGDNPVRRTFLPAEERPDKGGWTAEEARRCLTAADGHRLSPLLRHHAATSGAVRF
jgi:hypothetical protein